MATTITTIKKARLGKQDMLFDVNGTNQTISTPRSDGTTRNVTKINASHLPTTTTTRAKKTAANVTLDETNVDTTLQQLLDDNLSQGIADGTILTVTAGVLAIADNGITQAKMAANSVDSDEYVDGSIDNEHLNPTSVSAAVAGSAATGGKVNVIQAASIGVANMAANSIDSDQYVDGSIDNIHIADNVIKASKMLDVPTHYIYFAGQINSTDTAATSTFTLSGMAANFTGNEIVQATLSAKGTSVDHIEMAVQTTSSKDVEVTFGTQQSGGTSTIHFTVLKAVTA